MRPAGEDEVDPAAATRGLFLIGAAPEAELAPVLAGGSIVGVLLATGPGGVSDRDRQMRSACRAAGVAAFAGSLEGADLLDADGVLLDAAEVGAARPRIGGRLIGARAGVSRHLAMVAGEDGADFVAFGEEDHAASERLIEIIAWWSELFVLPSLALADRLDDEAAARLALAGADFLGIPAERVAGEPGAIDRFGRAFGLTPAG